MLEFRYIKNRYWQTFVLCLLVSALLFLPICLRNAMQGTYFTYAGDYNSQQINFYQYANAFIKQGGTFSWETDLGSGFINSYSFYCLGSPFFWLGLLVPSALMPWAMVPLLCLKFAVAGGGGYLWAKRYVKNTQYAMLAGVLYAFSGYSVYSIFFNHFLDVIALFPYLLASLDDALIDGKHGAFPFWVALNLINNYYFFFGQAIFLVLYLACLLLGGRCRLTLRKFGRMAFETALGVCLGCVLLVPAVLSLLQNPRVSNLLNGYEFFSYDSAQQYIAIVANLFLMPDTPYSSTMFQNAAVKWRNLTAYLPVVGITGGLALCRGRRRDAFARLLRFCLLCAFVPMLNNLFNGLNALYYARWFYMPVLVLCGATALALDDETLCRAEWAGAWRTVLAFTLGFAALGLVPDTVPIFGTQLGVVKSAYIFWLLWGVSLAGVILCGVLHKKHYGTEQFVSAMLSGVLVFSFLYGETHLLLTRYEADNEEEVNWADGLADLENVSALLPQGEFYRTDTGDEDNYNLVLGTSTQSFFNTTVSPGIFSFFNGVGCGRGVTTSAPQSMYALRSLLSTRYLLIRPVNEESWCAESVEGDTVFVTEENKDEYIAQMTGEEEMPEITYIRAEWADNYEEIGRTEEFIVYENKNFISMGFTYDYYITTEQYEAADAADRPNLLLKALVLTDEQIEEYGDLLAPLPESELENCTFAAFEDDCAARRAGTVQSFAADNYGFSAETDFAQDELVFFSVPYEENAFTATVNGESVTVEQVDEGLMAIRVPAGACTVRVDYHTPGLNVGLCLTGAAAVVYGAYAAFLWRRKKKGAVAEGAGTQAAAQDVTETGTQSGTEDVTEGALERVTEETPESVTRF